MDQKKNNETEHNKIVIVTEPCLKFTENTKIRSNIHVESNKPDITFARRFWLLLNQPGKLHVTQSAHVS